MRREDLGITNLSEKEEALRHEGERWGPVPKRLPGRQSLEATKVLVAREKGGQVRTKNRRLASSRIGTHPAPGGTEYSARAWDRGPDPWANGGQCPGFARGGEVAPRMLRSLALRGRRAREAPVAPGATTWRRRGTLAQGPVAIAARARPCGARLGSGPWRCSGWRQRRMSPPGASGRYPTNDFPSVRHQILIVKLSILSVQRAHLSQF